MKMRTEIAAGVAAAIMISLVGCGSSDVPAGPPEIEATDIAIVSGYHQNAVTPPINNSEILKAFDALAEQVHQMEKQIAEAGGGALPTEDGVLPQYQALWEKNQDLAGWLSIEGTAIDYPVMHTAQDEEYYLRRAFDRSNSVSGTPFLAAGCFTGCGNYIIYGHNMKDGSMFAALLNYADDTFWEEHPTIRFDTLEETGTYQVLAAFYIDVSLSEDGVAFPFYEYTGLRDEAIFQEYLAQVGDRALYSTGVTAEFGEQLLTLSTCSYNTSDERFVVVAKQVV